MIAHHSWYSRVYRKHNIAIMIVFSWMFSYGMQIPTLVAVWGKLELRMVKKKSNCMTKGTEQESVENNCE